MKKSDKLQRENIEMEQQLNELRCQIAKDKVRYKPSEGESMWQSSKSDIGTLRSYGKQVRVKSKTSKLKSAETQDSKTNVRQWSKEQVSQWLKSIELERFVEKFAENEITGEVLLELGIDDLDYMGISALGDRKTLLKEIARLKHTLNPSERPVSRGNLQALNSARGSENGSSKNLDSGRGSKFDGVYDEEAERQAFQRAVMEWRTGGKKTEEDSQKSASTTQDDSFEKREQIAFRKAVEEWRSHGGNVKIMDYDGYREEIVADRQSRQEELIAEFEKQLHASKSQKVPVLFNKETKSSSEDNHDVEDEAFDFESVY